MIAFGCGSLEHSAAAAIIIMVGGDGDGDGNQPPELVPCALFDRLDTVPSGTNKPLTPKYNKVPTLDKTADVTPFLEKIGSKGGRGQYNKLFNNYSFGGELWDNVRIMHRNRPKRCSAGWYF